MSGSCVLCVDDEPGIRYTTKLLLEGAGYYVLTADNVDDAASLLSGRIVDVVLMDCLPGKESLIRRIRDESTRTRVLLLTGELDPDASGVDGVLLKPCRIEELLGAVRALIATKGFLEDEVA